MGVTVPSNINIQNNLQDGYSVATSVAPALSTDYWGIDSNSAIAGQLTQILWMDRNEGIKNGDTWVFTSSLTIAGVAVELQEKLTGTFASSDIWIQITAGSKSTGWDSSNTSLQFTGNDNNTYEINGVFFLNGSYDDVTYTLLVL